MGLKTFIGGVHPYEGKELAKDAPIKEVLPILVPSFLIFLSKPYSL
jgi:hypothetical protein